MHRTISAPNLQNLDESCPTEDLKRTSSDTSTSTPNNGFGNPETSGINPENPKISSRKDFVANTNLNKYVSSSNLSLKAQDSHLGSKTSQNSDAIRRYLSSNQSLDAQNSNILASNQSEHTINSEAIRQYLSKYIYHKPLLEIEHWLEYQIFPLELQPLSRSTKSSPNYELQSAKPPSNFDENFIEDFRNNPDAYREILGSSPDDSVISGLITLTEAKPRPKQFFLPKPKTTMPEGTFYNRNVIVAPSPDSYAAENYKILKKPEVSKYIRVPYEKMILKPETDRPMTHTNVSKFLVPSASVKSATGTLNLVQPDYSFASASVFLQSSGNLFPESKSEEVCRNEICIGGSNQEEEMLGKKEVEEVQAAPPTQNEDLCCTCEDELDNQNVRGKKTGVHAAALSQKESKEIERRRKEEERRAKEEEKLLKDELKKEAEKNRKEEARLKKEEDKRKKEEVKRKKEEDKKRKEEEKIKSKMVKVPCECKAEKKPDGSCVCPGTTKKNICCAGKTRKPKSCECKPVLLPCEEACGTTCEGGYYEDGEIAAQQTYENQSSPPEPKLSSDIFYPYEEDRRVKISESKTSRKSLPRTESRLIRNSFVFDQDKMVDEQTGKVHATPDKKVQISAADSKMMITPIVETDIETRDDLSCSQTCAPLKCRNYQTNEFKEDARDEVYSAPPLRKLTPKCSSNGEASFLERTREGEVFAAPPSFEESFEATNRNEVFAAPKKPSVYKTSYTGLDVEEEFAAERQGEVYASAPQKVEENFEQTNEGQVFASPNKRESGRRTSRKEDDEEREVYAATPQEIEENFEQANERQVFASPNKRESRWRTSRDRDVEEGNVYAAEPQGIEDNFEQANEGQVFASPNKRESARRTSRRRDDEEGEAYVAAPQEIEDNFEQANEGQVFASPNKRESARRTSRRRDDEEGEAYAAAPQEIEDNFEQTNEGQVFASPSKRESARRPSRKREDEEGEAYAAAPQEIEDNFEQTNEGQVFASPSKRESARRTSRRRDDEEGEAYATAPQEIEDNFEQTNEGQVFASPNKRESVRRTSRDGTDKKKESKLSIATMEYRGSKQEPKRTSVIYEEENQGKVQFAPTKRQSSKRATISEEDKNFSDVWMRTVGEETETVQETTGGQVFAAPPMPRNASRTSRRTLICEGVGTENDVCEKECDQECKTSVEICCPANEGRSCSGCKGKKKAKKGKKFQKFQQVNEEDEENEEEIVVEDKQDVVYAAPVRRDSKRTSKIGMAKKCEDLEDEEEDRRSKRPSKTRRSSVLEQQNVGEVSAPPPPPKWRSSRSDRVYFPGDTLGQVNYNDVFAAPPPPKRHSSRRRSSDDRPSLRDRKPTGYSFLEEEDEFEVADRPEVFAAPATKRRSSKMKYPCTANCKGRIGFCEDEIVCESGSCGSRASCRINLTEVIQDEIQRASIAKVESAPPKRKSVSDSVDEEEEENCKPSIAKGKDVTCTICKSCLSVGKVIEENIQQTVQRLVESAAPTKKSSVESFDSHATCYDNNKKKRLGRESSVLSRRQQSTMLHSAPPKQNLEDEILMIDNFSEPEKTTDDARFSISLDPKGLKDLSQLLRLSENWDEQLNNSVYQNEARRLSAYSSSQNRRSSLDDRFSAAQNNGQVFAAPPPRRNSSEDRRQTIEEFFYDPKDEGLVFAAPPARDASRSQYSTASRRQTVGEVFDDPRNEGQVFAAPPARDPSKIQYSMASRRQTVSEVYDDPKNEGQVFAAPPPRDPSKSQYSTVSRRETIIEVFDEPKNEGQVFAAPPARDPSKSQYSTASRRQTMVEVLDDPKNDEQVFAAPPPRDPSKSQYSTVSRRETIIEVFDEPKNEEQVFAAPPARDPSKSQYSTVSRKQTSFEVFDEPKNEEQVFAAPPARDPSKSQYSTVSRRQTVNEALADQTNEGQVYAAPPPRDPSKSQYSTVSRRQTVNEVLDDRKSEGQVFAAPPPRDPSKSRYSTVSRRQTVNEVVDDQKSEGQVFAAPPPRDPSKSRYSTVSRRQTVNGAFDDQQNEEQAFAAPAPRDPSESQYSTASQRQTVYEVFNDPNNEEQVFAAPPPRDPSRSKYSTASRRQTVHEVLDDPQNEGQVFAAPPPRVPSRSQYSTGPRQTVDEIFDAPQNEEEVFAAPPSRKSQQSRASRRQTVDEAFDEPENQGQVYAAPPPRKSRYSTASKRQTVDEVFDESQNQGQVYAAPPPRKSRYSTASKRQTVDEVFDESQNQGQVYAAPPLRKSRYSTASRRQTVDEVFDESENQSPVYAAPPSRKSKYSTVSRRQTVDEVFDESQNEGQVYAAPPPRRSQYSPSSSRSHRQYVDEVFDDPYNEGQVFAAPPPTSKSRSQFSPSSSGSRRLSVDEVFDDPYNENQVFAAPPPRDKSRSQYSPSSSGSRRQTVDEMFDEGRFEGEVYTAPPPSSPSRSEYSSSPTSSESRRQTVDEVFDGPQNETQVYAPPPSRKSQYSNMDGRKTISEIYDEPANQNETYAAPRRRSSKESHESVNRMSSASRSSQNRRTVGEIFDGPQNQTQNFAAPPPRSQMANSCSGCKSCKPCPCPKRFQQAGEDYNEQSLREDRDKVYAQPNKIPEVAPRMVEASSKMLNPRPCYCPENPVSNKIGGGVLEEEMEDSNNPEIFAEVKRRLEKIENERPSYYPKNPVGDKWHSVSSTSMKKSPGESFASPKKTSSSKCPKTCCDPITCGLKFGNAQPEPTVSYQKTELSEKLETAYPPYTELSSLKKIEEEDLSKITTSNVLVQAQAPENKGSQTIVDAGTSMNRPEERMTEETAKSVHAIAPIPEESEPQAVTCTVCDACVEEKQRTQSRLSKFLNSAKPKKSRTSQVSHTEIDIQPYENQNVFAEFPSQDKTLLFSQTDFGDYPMSQASQAPEIELEAKSKRSKQGSIRTCPNEREASVRSEDRVSFAGLRVSSKESFTNTITESTPDTRRMSAGKEIFNDTPRRSSKKSILTIDAIFPGKTGDVKATGGDLKDFVIAGVAQNEQQVEKASSYEAESGNPDKSKDAKKEKENSNKKEKKGDEPKKIYCGADKNPCEIRYAHTIISKFRDFTVYEVMRSTTKKPSKVTDVTEGVFVVKKHS